MDKHRPKTVGADPDSNLHDLLSVLLGFFGFILLVTLDWHIQPPAVDYPFYKGPKIFPLLVLSMMTVSALPSLYCLLRSFRQRRWRLDGYGLPAKPVVVTVLLVLFFLFGIAWVGIELSAFAFMSLSFLVVGYRRLTVTALYPLLYTAFIVLLFKHILKVWFPAPLLLSLFGS